MSLDTLAREASARLHALLKTGHIARIDIDIVRAHIAAVAQYEMLLPEARHALEQATLRRVVETVG